MARAVAGSLGIICQFHGLRHLPLADVNMIAAASPIFTVFFAWIYIRERAGPADFVNLLLVFAGKEQPLAASGAHQTFGNLDSQVSC